ncbi:hypothetical protein AN963_09925 [Brevibacillus choshinensis]|uniref:ABC transporter domain-containing protein n=1 Tax=Brevibacillus choshinensis TaxID=54911 RepID=A0ABR5NEK5_BRECH|nr:dipeptide ABC transporter ATP-binding protein [Brevibacillus choshinensis]KQL49972.1 hypothetical protein AN963_09925 [Brevibacillus choshinensis]
MERLPLLEVRGLKKYYESNQGWAKPKGIVKAVDDISFALYRGETLSLVGESGCGKSTTGKTILRLYGHTAGSIHFEGQDIGQLAYEEMRQLRREMQMVFQDPFASLNPKKTVRQILLEPLRVHGIGQASERLGMVKRFLEIVGLAEYHLDKYPHEFSGGQRQRIAIARAVILKPKLIVADEPVSALDISVQSQVINLLLQLQKELNLAYLFISHDLGVVKHISDRIAVMYLGRIVELAEAEELFAAPKHPYTQSLISAIPKRHPDEKNDRIILKGDVPSPSNPPTGCAFHPRCPMVMAICEHTSPPVMQLENGHTVRCHLYVDHPKNV